MENSKSVKVPTLNELFGYGKLPDYLGLIGSIPVRFSDVMIGVELEIENIKNVAVGLSSISSDIDNSLKLDGMEFITIPIKLKFLEIELRRLFSILNNDEKATPIISKRCSTHLHLNMRDVTVEQLKMFILLYIIFERSLYRISGGREKSNFCIPLYDIPDKVEKFFIKINKLELLQWNKYIGLNLCPLKGGDGSKTLGTVEFRHMHGTLDVYEIMYWANIVASLKRTVQKYNVQNLYDFIFNTKRTKNYKELANLVFKPYWAAPIVDSEFFNDEIALGLDYFMFCSSIVGKEKYLIKEVEEVGEGELIEPKLQTKLMQEQTL